MITFLKIRGLNWEILHWIYDFDKVNYSCELNDLWLMDFELDISSPDIPFLKTNWVFNRIELIKQEWEEVLFSWYIKWYKWSSEILKVFCQQEKRILELTMLNANISFTKLTDVLNSTWLKYIIKKDYEFKSIRFNFWTTYLKILNEISEILWINFTVVNSVIHFYNWWKDYSENKVAILDINSNEENNITNLEMTSWENFTKLFARWWNHKIVIWDWNIHWFKYFDTNTKNWLIEQWKLYLEKYKKSQDLISFDIVWNDFLNINPWDKIFVKINLKWSIFDLCRKMIIINKKVDFTTWWPNIKFWIAKNVIKVNNTQNFFTNIKKDINKLLLI